MAADGRRVGHDQGKRLVEAYSPAEGRIALRLAIEAEEAGVCRDAWCGGYVEGLHDALREFEGKWNLSRLDQ
jgi:hypothetical protein